MGPAQCIPQLYAQMLRQQQENQQKAQQQARQAGNAVVNGLNESLEHDGNFDASPFVSNNSDLDHALASDPSLLFPQYGQRPEFQNVENPSLSSGEALLERFSRSCKKCGKYTARFDPHEVCVYGTY